MSMSSSLIRRVNRGVNLADRNVIKNIDSYIQPVAPVQFKGVTHPIGTVLQEVLDRKAKLDQAIVNRNSKLGIK